MSQYLRDNIHYIHELFPLGRDLCMFLLYTQNDIQLYFRILQTQDHSIENAVYYSVKHIFLLSPQTHQLQKERIARLQADPKVLLQNYLMLLLEMSERGLWYRQAEKSYHKLLFHTQILQGLYFLPFYLRSI